MIRGPAEITDGAEIEEADFQRPLGTLRVGTEVLFSRLPPGGALPLHSDGANYVINVHLAIAAEGAVISVAGNDYVYKNQQVFCFDPSFMHEVKNDGPNFRDVFLLNVWHPDLSDKEIAAIQFVRGKLEAFSAAWR